ncbi:hypothetical protein CKO23_23485 [Thiocystis violacea]|nr:hypothetical protein [Thiocystis violacea]
MSERDTLDPHAAEYQDWLRALKRRVRQVQLKAAVAVNRELLSFYWALGADIVERQENAAWGTGFLQQLSKDLMAEPPGMKGFSLSNIKYIRQRFLFYSSAAPIGQQPVAQFETSPIAQITQIPWGHNLAIISKCKRIDEALYYARNTIAHGWSRSVLTHQIESGLWQREGKAITNFTEALPAPQSDLAIQTLKDPYVFDFLTLTKDHNERELEAGLIEHSTHFLLELGAGFASLGSPLNRSSSTDGLREGGRGLAGGHLPSAGWGVLFGVAGSVRVPCSAQARSQSRVRVPGRTPSHGCGTAGG